MLGRAASNPSTITFSHCISGFFAAPSVHTSHLRSHLLHNLSSPSLNHSLLANPIYPKYKEQFRKASTQQPLLGKSSVSRNLYSTLENDCPRDNTFVDSTMTVEVSPGAPSTPKEIISSLPECFDKAKESGELLFFPSTVHTHPENGVEVCLTLLFQTHLN